MREALFTALAQDISRGSKDSFCGRGGRNIRSAQLCLHMRRSAWQSPAFKEGNMAKR
jgi:hypothetical protein